MLELAAGPDVLQSRNVDTGITEFATHAPAFVQVLYLCSTFRSTQDKLDLGHVEQYDDTVAAAMPQFPSIRLLLYLT